MITNKTYAVPYGSIVVDREARSRSNINPSAVADLAQSISNNGLIHTLLIELDTNKLIAGEHRLEAFRLLRESAAPCQFPEYENWTLIPCRYASDVTEAEVIVLELEENIKRSSMEWKDEAASIKQFHEMKSKLDGTWNITRTANALAMSLSQVSKFIQVGTALSDPKVAMASTFSAAYGVLERQRDRDISAELEDLTAVAMRSESTGDIPPPETEDFKSGIITTDFSEWCQTYSGPKFTLVHFDPPYGINHQKSDQGGAVDWGSYEDTPEIFWQLNSTLLENLPKLLSPGAHIFYWFSMNYYEALRSSLTAAGLTVNPFPLIWHKSDNSGILPDPKRGPRRTYETAFLCTWGDRYVVKSVSNSYAAPNTKTSHLSEKPESVLRHFFQMLVDEHTSVLDPTCGSGSALRAAESLGAKSVLGLELNPQFAEDARELLARSRILRGDMK